MLDNYNKHSKSVGYVIIGLEKSPWILDVETNTTPKTDVVLGTGLETVNLLT